jgi:tripartite-type tricarboxylate transporter receptor subunit TctC
MPAEAVKAWDEAVRRALQDPALIKRLQEAGYTPLYEGPTAFASRLDSDRKRWKEVIQASKVSAQ